MRKNGWEVLRAKGQEGREKLSWNTTDSLCSRAHSKEPAQDQAGGDTIDRLGWGGRAGESGFCFCKGVVIKGW